MNQLVVTDLPYINKQISSPVWFEPPLTISVYEPYKNNTIICNQNFVKIDTLMTNLTNQLVQSNTQINNLNNEINSLKQSLNNTNQTIINNNTQMQNMQQNIQTLTNDNNVLRNLINDNNTHITNVQTEVVTLGEKIGTLISFIPEFVKRTSQFFVKLLLKIKTGSLEDIEELEYDTHMLTNYNNIV